jgi:hypothetical protein
MKIILKGTDGVGGKVDIFDNDGNDLSEKLTIISVEVKCVGGSRATATIKCVDVELDADVAGLTVVDVGGLVKDINDAAREHNP